MRRLIIPTLIASIVLLAGCSSQAIDDSAVTAKVKSKLATDSETSAIKISVETKNGTVILTGTVPTDTEKDKAGQIARNTEGVKQVKNDITVNPNSTSATNLGEKAGEAAKDVGESLSDAAILAKVKAKLVADGISGTNVDVTDGQVVLNGEVEDATKKAKAESIAKTTAGVRDVKNQLKIKKDKA